MRKTPIGLNRLRKNSFSCFDTLMLRHAQQNGETSMISIPGPFVLSLSKASPELVEGGEQRVFPQPAKPHFPL